MIFFSLSFIYFEARRYSLILSWSCADSILFIIDKNLYIRLTSKKEKIPGFYRRHWFEILYHFVIVANSTAIYSQFLLFIFFFFYYFLTFYLTTNMFFPMMLLNMRVVWRVRMIIAIDTLLAIRIITTTTQ